MKNPKKAHTMLSHTQHTLRQKVQCTGKGLHSGKDVTLTLLPAAVGTGIVFERTDVPAGTGVIPAKFDRVSDTRFCSTLTNSHGVSIGTVEHVMAALAGLGVDNAHILVSGAEVPIMDGSAEPFVFLMECAGLVKERAEREYLRVTRTVRAQLGESWIELRPSQGFSMALDIDFGHQVIGHQSLEVDFAGSSFKNTLCRARTFGFEEDVQKMQAAGLALGGSLDNAIVVGKNAVLNDGGLRYGNEFIRHKMLDCLGDLYLAGKPLLAEVHGSKIGHGVNNAVLHALFADQSAYEIVTLAEIEPSIMVEQAVVAQLALRA
jgi:UDP-3-O-[3-hydroxymyristoyl] N-acetylglucosamine deacetylase